MKIAERIVMVSLTLILIGGGVWFYFAINYEPKGVNGPASLVDYEIYDVYDSEITVEEWQLIYPNTVPLKIGEAVVQASVASTLPERIRGLSNTPFLPDDVVKLFVFGTLGSHSIWMKDMNYSIDIIWATEDGVIVHIEKNVSPETFPNSFESPIPAWFVIETNAGFVDNNSIVLGDKVSLIN